ncbi:hypothetical protein L249_4565 [Ophiocordyceps polyrhachis-furcata BCC 54312]|uniref:Serine aminopeptidase S33 domain-containing protein n=1 Tax=Ophiocordyceps polyrhachis-furcata BCC 54312 TaxID=1330021 RepID=A0A367KZ72_9HYPO|nr:hypothetical protein L249_4565 [Ophiocordyceps polyrhachis-furcata BCC 54312]
MPRTVHFNIQEHIISGCHVRQYPGLTSGRQEEDMRLHVKQYTPRNQPLESSDAVTLIAMQGIGFPKELYEPLWDHLHHHSRSHGYCIRSIWMADMAPQGISGILNEKNMSMDNSWEDHTRDVFHMINHFRNEMPRPLVGVGHSCGGLQMANLAHIHPRLFTTVILMDPAFLVNEKGEIIYPEKAIRDITHGKDLWRTRAEAAAFVEKTYPAWDQRVKRRMIQYGFRDLPTALYPELPPEADVADPPVTLTTTKHQMAMMLVRPCFDGLDHVDAKRRTNKSFHRPEVVPSAERMKTLRPPTLFLLGRHTNRRWLEAIRRTADATGLGVGGSGGKPEGRVREVMVRAGHAFPFTAVGETGLACSAWLGEEMGTDHLVLPLKWKEMFRPRDDEAARSRL